MFQEAREWLKKVYVSESGSKMHEIPSDGTEYEVVDDRVFQSMCETPRRRVFSVIRMPHYTEEEVMDNGKTPLLMVLEDLQTLEMSEQSSAPQAAGVQPASS